MTGFRMAGLAGAVLLGGVWSGAASSAPVARAGDLVVPGGIEQARNHHWHRQRCWWETRRVRDHRGRWVNRRVQVCVR